jgi:hypothetical protein
VLPLTVVDRLARAAEARGGVEVWWPLMRDVASGIPRGEAERLQREDPARRAMMCYRNNGCKVVEFKGFLRVKRVRLEGEPVALS